MVNLSDLASHARVYTPVQSLRKSPKHRNDFKEIGYAPMVLFFMCLMRIKHEGYMLANRHRLFQ